MTTRAIRRRSHRLLAPPPGTAFPANAATTGIYVGRASDPGYPYRATEWATTTSMQSASLSSAGIQQVATGRK